MSAPGQGIDWRDFRDHSDDANDQKVETSSFAKLFEQNFGNKRPQRISASHAPRVSIGYVTVH